MCETFLFKKLPYKFLSRVDTGKVFCIFTRKQHARIYLMKVLYPQYYKWMLKYNSISVGLIINYLPMFGIKISSMV